MLYRIVHLVTVLLLLSASPASAEDGGPVPLLEIELEGVRGEVYDNVFGYLSVVREREHPRLTLRRIKRLHTRAEKEIQRALQPFGYYRAQVESRLESVPCQERAPTAEESVETRDPCARPTWRASYRIEPGPPLEIAELDLQIEGAARKDAAFQTWRKEFPLQVGDPLAHAAYEKAKRTLLGLAQARGYFRADLDKSEIRIDLEAYRAVIVLHLNSGPRYRFGEVEFKQEREVFAPEFLQRFVDFEPGDPYDAEVLLSLRNDLTGSEYFAEANLEVDTEDLSSEDAPVEIRVEPRKPNQYTAGIGYGTDTGVRGSLGWERRYLNRRGHRFSTEAVATGGSGDSLDNRSLQYSATYFVPMGHPNREYLAFNFGYLDEVSNIGDTQTGLLGAAYHRPRKYALPWFGALPLQEIISLEYRYERFSLGDSGKNSTNLLMPGVEWTYLEADDRVNTRRGQKVSLGLRSAGKYLGSDVSFGQAHLEGKVIRGLGRRGRVLARGEAGYSIVDGFADLPASQRFFAGGDRSVRGYRYQTLGETDSTGAVIGGKHVLTGSLEYDYRFLDKWSGAVFYDAGNAFNAFGSSVEHGAGIGMRWLSPIGPVRLDLATPLRTENAGVQVHITIGPDL